MGHSAQSELIEWANATLYSTSTATQFNLWYCWPPSGYSLAWGESLGHLDLSVQHSLQPFSSCFFFQHAQEGGEGRAEANDASTQNVLWDQAPRLAAWQPLIITVMAGQPKESLELCLWSRTERLEMFPACDQLKKFPSSEDLECVGGGQVGWWLLLVLVELLRKLSTDSSCLIWRALLSVWSLFLKLVEFTYSLCNKVTEVNPYRLFPFGKYKMFVPEKKKLDRRENIYIWKTLPTAKRLLYLNLKVLYKML